MAQCTEYIAILTLAEAACYMRPDIDKYAEGKLYCPRCQEIWEEIEEVDIVIGDRSCLRKRVPFNFLSGCLIPVVHDSFLSCFPEHEVRKNLFLGRVYSEKGELMSEWHTARGKHRLILRGTKNASYRICEICRRPVYFSNWGFFLYPPPPPEISIFTSGAKFIARTDVVDLDLLRKMRKLHFVKLPVVDSPLDSLGDIEGEYVPPENPSWSVSDFVVSSE